ncbi:19834_t:CDS:2 [Entrophospora sp. SA101]|nr:19834_t:CDS:2 [Entrophospora sp. SA101]
MRNIGHNRATCPLNKTNEYDLTSLAIAMSKCFNRNPVDCSILDFLNEYDLEPPELPDTGEEGKQVVQPMQEIEEQEEYEDTEVTK